MSEAGASNLRGSGRASGPMGRQRRFALAIGYVVATLLSFPHPLFDRVLDLGLVMAWLGPAFLLLAIDGLAPRRAALVGLAAGLLANASVLHWIYVVTVVYGHAPVIVGWIAPFGAALYGACFTAAFAAAFAWLAQRGAGTVWAGAAIWAALDHARTWFLGGFPWVTLGYAQHDNTWLIGIASLTGVFGLSFASVLGGAALARIARARRLVPEAMFALAVVLALHGLGAGLRAAASSGDAEAPSVRIAAVQGNIDQREKWSAGRFEETVAIYESLTRDAASRGAQIVVWPETAMPTPVELDSRLRARLSALARENATSLVVGAVGREIGPHGRVAAYYDSAFAIGPDGVWLGRYDKTQLVPFGEYLPLRALFGRFIEAVARGAADRDIAAGPEPVAIELPVLASTDAAGRRIVPIAADNEPGGGSDSRATGGRDPQRSFRVGVPICYELLFPDLVRRFVRDGAGGLLAITNDAWYGRTGAPYQFLAMTALRSAETGVWLVRAANTGVSAVIDAQGRVRQQTRIFEPAVVVADVPLAAPGARATFYVRHGDVFAGACWVAWAGLAASAWRRSRGAASARIAEG